MEKERRTHIGRLLLELDKDFTASAIEILRRSGFSFVQASHIYVIAAIDTAGTPLAKVIERTKNSKQAINKVLIQLEKFNLIERSTAKDDSRARIIQFTKSGQAFMKSAIKAVTSVEKEYREILGETTFELVRSKLIHLAEKRKIL